MIFLLSLSGDINLPACVSKTLSGQYSVSELHLQSLNLFLWSSPSSGIKQISASFPILMIVSRQKALKGATSNFYSHIAGSRLCAMLVGKVG